MHTADIYHAPYPYAFRPPRGVAPTDVADHALGALDDLLTYRVMPSRVAAVIVEPLQGEGGYIAPPAGFLTELRRWCTANDILLIADEIQTGYGRTGRMFAVNHESVMPDILILGKSIASGFPLAATVAPRTLFERVHPGDIGGTYGGNPVACAAALGVLEVFDAEDVIGRATDVGKATRAALDHIASALSAVGEVRGLGPMLAMEIVDPSDRRTPSTELARGLVEEARRRGVLLIKAGVFDNVVRVLPPLTISDDDLSRGLSMVEAAAEAVLPR